MPPEDAVKPLIRSHERVFILWGMADEPTWPGWKPSVTSSWPAISRMVVARLAGRGRLHERGDHLEIERARVHLADAVEHGLEAEVPGDRRFQLVDLAGSPPKRSSWSCCVPTGPLRPRSG